MKDQKPPQEHRPEPRIPAEKRERDRDDCDDTEHDTAEPQPGIGQYQGGGIDGAIGGGTSGQGGG